MQWGGGGGGCLLLFCTEAFLPTGRKNKSGLPLTQMLTRSDWGKALYFPWCEWPVRRQGDGHFLSMQVQRTGQKAQPAPEKKAGSEPMLPLRGVRPGDWRVWPCPQHLSALPFAWEITCFVWSFLAQKAWLRAMCVECKNGADLGKLALMVPTHLEPLRLRAESMEPKVQCSNETHGQVMVFINSESYST